MAAYGCWGNFPVARDQIVKTMRWRSDALPLPRNGSTVLPRGLGRSYGDSCLNEGGTLIDSTRLDHFMALDPRSGVLRCEAGVSLAALLAIATRAGWFPPVTPGTKHVTVGGAIANDVHGKNHHRCGTFGRFVRCFELLRSDGRRILCSPEENRELFGATIGGLGLTGMITWAEIELKAIESECIDFQSVRLRDLDEFFDRVKTADAEFEYTVAWIDCLARGRRQGRGLLLLGNHAAAGGSGGRPPGRRSVSVPAFAPEFLLKPWTVRAFNGLHYRRQLTQVKRRLVHYDPFFYLLDSIANWNRLYGRRGFLQYQLVVPHEGAREVLRDVFSRLARGGEGAFLAVLKIFGDLPSPGLLSFPRPGVTLALDFPNRGSSTLELLESLDAIVRASGGRVYPAKDARMSGESFRAYYPEWRKLAAHVDPRFSSSFWRRVTAGAEAA